MDSWFSPQLKAALIRALGNALSAFVLATAFALSQGLSLQVAVGVGLTAAAGTFGFRTVGEGLYDTSRARSGAVKPSDVGAAPFASRSR